MRLNGFLFLTIIALSLIITSCGPDSSNVDAGHTDSVNAKYKDNKELQTLNKQIRENPDADSLYRQRAELYMKLQDYELAHGDAVRALNIDSSTSKNYLTLTDIYYVTNQTRKAKETLERCLKSLPNDKDANLKMAELYFYVKKYQESLNHINKALEVDQYMAKGYFLKGMNYMEIGDTAKAINSFQTAVEQDNNYYTAYIQLGLMHYFKHNPLALAYFDNALRIQPNSLEALYGKARFLQDDGKYKEAKTLYEQILKLDPTHKSGLYNLGAILLSRDKKPAEAMQYFDRAINAFPDYTEAWFARGVCNEKLNRKTEAIADYKKALSLTPNYEPAISALNKLEK